MCSVMLTFLPIYSAVRMVTGSLECSDYLHDRVSVTAVWDTMLKQRNW